MALRTVEQRKKVLHIANKQNKRTASSVGCASSVCTARRLRAGNCVRVGLSSSMNWMPSFTTWGRCGRYSKNN